MGRWSVEWARVSDQLRQLGQWLLDRVTLPDAIGPLEAQFRRDTCRVATAWFAGHVPVLTVLAALGRSGVFVALGISLAIALAASRVGAVLRAPRHASWALGVLAMFEAALVLHVLDGPWAALGPAYLFATLLMLALLADPVVIVLAMATSATTHAAATIWFPGDLPPSSAELLARMFGLVLTSVLAIAVARRLFDAGSAVEHELEAREAEAAERNREIEVVLEQSPQAILTIRPDGTIGTRWSRPTETWLGDPRPGTPVWELFARHDETFAQWLALGWQAIDEDVLPHALALDQMPKRLVADGRHLEVEYRAAGAVYLMVLTDRSERAARERAEASQAETVRAFEHFSRDRNGFFALWGALDQQVAELCADPPVLLPVAVARALRTVCARATAAGWTSVAAACLRIERDIQDTGDPPSVADLRDIAEAWHHLGERLSPLFALGPLEVEVDLSDLEHLLGAIRARLPHGDLEDEVLGLRLEPVRRPFARLEAHARFTAERLGVGQLHVITDDGGVRLDRVATAPFWSSLVHVVDNAIDHGLREVEGLRQLTMTARQVYDGAVEITIADSGIGIRWERVATAAAMRGLPLSTRRALIDAMFADRLSTRDEASDVSGHGRGLADVRVACETLGIERRVASETALGTTFTFVLPREMTGAAPRADEWHARAS